MTIIVDTSRINRPCFDGRGGDGWCLTSSYLFDKTNERMFSNRIGIVTHGLSRICTVTHKLSRIGTVTHGLSSLIGTVTYGLSRIGTVTHELSRTDNVTHELSSRMNCYVLVPAHMDCHTWHPTIESVTLHIQCRPTYFLNIFHIK